MFGRISSLASARFWPAYIAPWTVYFSLNVLAWLVTGRVPIATALEGSFLAVLPQAALGLAALRMAKRLPWPGGARLRFYALHLVLAISYGITSAAGMNFLFALHRFATEGVFWPRFFDVGIVTWQVFMAVLVYGVLVSVAYAFQLQDRLREGERRAARALALQSEAELRALRAQLNPHFLFNTLHSLLALVRRDTAAAEDGLEQFGDLLHYALRVQQEGRDAVPFEAEWEFVQNYLSLEKLRLGDRLRLDCRVDPSTLRFPVPVFSLQPLVENAIRHGVAPRAEGGRIDIVSELREDGLHLSVRDDGPGSAQEAPSSGMGLRLIRERLATLYGDAAGLSIDSESGEGFLVSMHLPRRALR